MKKTLILCEGVTDQVFIADCLQLFYNIQLLRKKNKIDNHIIDMAFFSENIDIKIKSVDGCEKLNKQTISQEMIDNIENGGRNIVVFDADFPSTAITEKNGNNGFENAQISLNATKEKVAFEYYLWPNNQGDGDIEMLLQQLIPTDKKPIMDCIEQHQGCLKKTGVPNLRYANRKDVLGYYLYTNSIEKTKGRDIDYTNAEFWNLKPSQNTALKKFKDFLDEYFL